MHAYIHIYLMCKDTTYNYICTCVHAYMCTPTAIACDSIEDQRLSTALVYRSLACRRGSCTFRPRIDAQKSSTAWLWPFVGPREHSTVPVLTPCPPPAAAKAPAFARFVPAFFRRLGCLRCNCLVDSICLYACCLLRLMLTLCPAWGGIVWRSVSWCDVALCGMVWHGVANGSLMFVET